MRLTKNNQKGDTIIEVLICLAVLGFVLVVAYTITSRALGSVRASQERVEALKIAEGQLEQLKSVGQSNPTSIFPGSVSPPNVYCLSNANVFGNFTIPTDIDADDFSTYHSPECKNIGPGNLYSVSVTGPGSGDGGLFVVRVRWNRYGSDKNDEVKLEYKLFKETP